MQSNAAKRSFIPFQAHSSHFNGSSRFNRSTAHQNNNISNTPLNRFLTTNNSINKIILKTELEDSIRSVLESRGS